MKSKTTEASPKVSVVMCVWNGEKYLRECIDSILNQSFQDFEFIIVNDGSTDGTAEILQTYAVQDPRVRILENPQNMGIGFSRNKGNAAARGDFIAIMDADDWSDPSRFVKQVNFLDENPEIYILGSSYVKQNLGESKSRLFQKSDLPNLVRWELVFSCAIGNPSVMMRRKLFSEEGFSYLEGIEAEDFELFTRVVQKHKLSNLPEPLHNYRWHDANLSVVKSDTQSAFINMAIRRQVKQYIGEEIPDSLMNGFKVPQIIAAFGDAKRIVSLYLKLLQASDKWQLTSAERAGIMRNFLHKLNVVARAVKKPRPFLITREGWVIFLTHYFVYLRFSCVEIFKRGQAKLMRVSGSSLNRNQEKHV